MSQAPTSSQQKSPCSARPMGSSSPAPHTSCGCTHPAGAAKFWLSTEGCAGTMPGHSASLFEHCWGPWDSCAPLAGARVASSLCVKGTAFAYCPPITPGNHPPITRYGRPGCHTTPPASPTGAHQQCFPHAETGSFISVVIWLFSLSVRRADGVVSICRI